MSQKTPTHFRAVIVGAGPAGIGAAIGLARRAVAPVLMIDRAPEIGGVPAHYPKRPGGVPTFVLWTRGRIVFGAELVKIISKRLARTSTRIWLESQVLSIDVAEKTITLVSPQYGKLRLSADAVLLATGAREKTRAERGWLPGHRPARVIHTMQLLDHLQRQHRAPSVRPAVVGSDLIAFSASAKLRAAGTEEVVMTDQTQKTRCGRLEKAYFRRWTRPRWESAGTSASINGDMAPEALILADGTRVDCDCVLLSGELVPNSELAVAGGLDVQMPERVPISSTGHALSAPGWFATGNVVGGFRGAQVCYWDGIRAAREVARFLKR